MKLFKMIKNFFKNIARFIDRKIILPITKLIVVITKKYDNSGKKIENWLSKRNTLLFISLILALAVFILIDRKIIVFTDSSAELLQDQPVEVIYNEEAYVVEGLPETVDITLIGSKTDLYVAKQSSTHDVSIDLSGLKAGTHKVNVDYNQNTGNIKYTVNPGVVTVVIYPKVSETKTLSVDILNQDSLDSKLAIDSIDYDTDKVVIKGAEHQLKNVAEVKALVDIDNLVSKEAGKTTLTDVPLKAYDKEGEIVDVEIVPEKIDVDVTISSPSKTLPIEVKPIGNVSFGLGISDISTNVNEVTVYGDDKSLADLKSIPIEIDVNNLKENKKYKVEIPKPVGVKSLSTNNITVDVTLTEATNAKFEDIKFRVDNLDTDKYYIEPIDGEASTQVDVTVKGAKSVIDSISSKYKEYIYPYIDLSGYTEGTYEVEVQVDGLENRLEYVANPKKVKIKIVKK